MSGRLRQEPTVGAALIERAFGVSIGIAVTILIAASVVAALLLDWR